MLRSMDSLVATVFESLAADIIAVMLLKSILLRSMDGLMFLALIAGAGFQDRPVVQSRQDVRNYLKSIEKLTSSRRRRTVVLISFMMMCYMKLSIMKN